MDQEKSFSKFGKTFQEGEMCFISEVRAMKNCANRVDPT